MAPRIVEGARFALRPRGVGASGADLSGLCPVVRDLLLVRSGARLLLAPPAGRSVVARACARHAAATNRARKGGLIIAIISGPIARAA
jgi:hypothetical protein